MRTLALLIACPLLLQADYNHWFTFGGDYTRVDYNGETGNMGGAQGFYEYAPNNNIYAGLILKYRQGSVESLSLLDINTAEYLGYSLQTGNWFCSFFSGLGFRFLQQTYSRTNDFYTFYVPVGIITEYTFNPTFTLCFDITYMPQFFSAVNIHLPGGAYYSLENTFGNLHIQMPLCFTLNQSGSWTLGLYPFYERFQTGPHNTYQFYGADLNLIYGF